MVSGIRFATLRRKCRCVLVLAALATVGCDKFYTVKHYQYKETVTFDTPEGLRSGSSVIEVVLEHPTYPSKPQFANFTPSGFNGEAVAVDLPNGKTVFALLSSSDDRFWAEKAFVNLVSDQDVIAELPNDYSPFQQRRFKLAMQLTGPQALPREWPKPRPRTIDGFIMEPQATFVPVPRPVPYPQLVTFRDPKDPGTLTVLRPDKTELALGKGYMLRGITLELTDAPPTTGIEHHLPWLAPTHVGDSGFSHAPQTPPNMAPNFGVQDFTVSGTNDKDYMMPIM